VPIRASGPQSIEHVFAKLFNTPAVVLLAQEGLGSVAISKEIKRRAAERFGVNAVFQVTPSYVTPQDGVGPYFESLLAQLRLATDTASPAVFNARLAAALGSGEPMCLLFTGIEHSPRVALEMLCGVLRALNERFGQFRVVLCGSERLCEMRYAKGALSYLSHAGEELWPEPSLSDLKAEATGQGCSELDEEVLIILQEVTGGHFGLLRELLRLIIDGERSREVLTQAVIDSPTIWAAVAPFRDSDEASRYLAAAAKSDNLGKIERHIKHPILRRMYWLNLITRRGSRARPFFAWRSPSIQEAVHRILSDA
jgi:hypothetical protein